MQNLQNPSNSVTLNEEQQAAAKAFFHFLMSEKKEFVISGGGGVGKSFLISHLKGSVIKEYYEMCKMLGIEANYHDVFITATTNKAAEVLATYLHEETSTIHSLLGLVVTINFKTGESSLKLKQNAQMVENAIIFVDEWSMLDHETITKILQRSPQSKIVYVGDDRQLAPVKGKEPVLNNRLHELPFYELTQPMRNADQPELQKLCSNLRETVKTGIYPEINVTPGVIEMLSTDGFQEKIDEHFSSNSHNNRILAFTNKKVIDYNDYIREIRNLGNNFSVGERLVINSPIIIGKETIANTDEIVTIESIGPIQKKNMGEDDPIEFRTMQATRERDGNKIPINVPVDMKDFSEALKHYKKIKDWGTYYELKQTFADLRQMDASTVHKAQGSSYDNVFIDLNDISKCTSSSEVARLIYVAVSRARKAVYFYGSLAERHLQ